MDKTRVCTFWWSIIVKYLKAVKDQILNLSVQYAKTNINKIEFYPICNIVNSKLMKLPKVVHNVKKPLKQSTRPNLTLPTITGKVLLNKVLRWALSDIWAGFSKVVLVLLKVAWADSCVVTVTYPGSAHATFRSTRTTLGFRPN